MAEYNNDDILNLETNKPLYVFSADEVHKVLPMKRAVDAMREAFRYHSAGRVNVPMRAHIKLPEYNGDVLVMPSYCSDLKQVGLKFITLHPDNIQKGLPFIQATVLLTDAQYGTLLAIINGAALTSIRTGAASGVATEILAREDSSHVAIIGSGTQAVTQLEAVCTVRNIKTAVFFDLNRERAKKYAKKLSDQLNIEITVADSVKSALKGADIICTATTSKKPVLDDADIEPGTHINAIGVYKPDEREIPGPTVARARVIVDEVEAAWEEAGELVLACKEGLIKKDHVAAELGQIIAGEKEGRQSDDQITFFKSVGIGTQDLFAAHAVFEEGVKLGLGEKVSF